MYIGIDRESFYDFWKESGTIHVHIGRLRLEWDYRLRLHGPTQKEPNQSKNRAIAQGHGGIPPA